jgi:hypothetical protein
MLARECNLRAIVLFSLVMPALASSSKMERVRFLENPPPTASPEVLLRQDPGDAPTDNFALRSSAQEVTASSTDTDPQAGERQLTLLGSATAAVSAAQQPSLDDPVRAFYRGLANPAAGSEEPLPAQQPAQLPAAAIQPPLPTLAPWGVSGTLPPTIPRAPMPLGVVPDGTIGRTSAGTDVKAKMGELNTAVNNVLTELTQQLEQQQRFAMEKEEMLEKEQAQVSSLTQENMQLGGQVAQLQASRVGMVEDAKSLSEDVQGRLVAWISKYESTMLRQAPGQAVLSGAAPAPPVQL